MSDIEVFIWTFSLLACLMCAAGCWVWSVLERMGQDADEIASHEHACD